MQTFNSAFLMCLWQFLRARWQSDPCYAFYRVDGSTCSILVYLSQVEDFCPAQPGRNHTAASWRHKTPSYTKQVFLFKLWFSLQIHRRYGDFCVFFGLVICRLSYGTLSVRSMRWLAAAAVRRWSSSGPEWRGCLKVGFGPGEEWSRTGTRWSHLRWRCSFPQTLGRKKAIL